MSPRNFSVPIEMKGDLIESPNSAYKILKITGGTRAVNGTGVMIECQMAGASQAGYLSPDDRNTFNGKQDALGFTAVPNTRQVNGHALTGDVTVTCSDLGAVPAFRQVNGHALSADITVTKSDVGLGNVPNLDTSNPANITQDLDHRFVTDLEISTWNGKQDYLGYTPAPLDGSVPFTAPTTIAQSHAGIINLLQVQNPAVGTFYGAGLVFTSEATHISGHPVDVACLQGICTETVYGDGMAVLLVASAGNLLEIMCWSPGSINIGRQTDIDYMLAGPDGALNHSGKNLLIRGGNAGAKTGGSYNGGHLFMIGGTKNDGDDGNVILGHDGTAARGLIALGTNTPVSGALLTVNGTLAFGTYMATPRTITGYITAYDTAGNAHKLACSD